MDTNASNVYIDRIWLEKAPEPTEPPTEPPTDEPSETPTAPPITEPTDIIDFGDDVTWLRIGKPDQFTQDKTVGYGDKTQSAKVTAKTTNTSGYFDLAAIGFKTDWSEYETINIRYRTSNTEYVPPVRLSTTKDWVSSSNEDKENAYKHTKADYAGKKAENADEWTVVSYSLKNDFAKRSSKNDNISWSNLKYMQIPTNYLHNYWNSNSGIAYREWKNTDEIYIDSIWLEKADTPTDKPTDTPTDTPTDKPTDKPTDTPTDTPTDKPTDTPTDTPTDKPTDTPTDTPTETPTDTPTDKPTDTPTDKPTDTPTEAPTAPPITEPTDIIDFGDDVTWLRIGETAQFSNDKKTGYGDKTQSAKVSGLTTNETGYFDLAAIGFKTDWTGYKTINIRYKTSNTGYVPPVRLSTIQTWVNSANEDTENAYKPKSGLYTSKKAKNADEWTVVSYSLENDFAKRSSKNDNISWSNLKYMQIPTNYLHNYWNGDSSVEYKKWNGADEIYIDSIWLDKADPETPTETPTIPPKGEYTGPNVAEQGLVASFRNEPTINAITQISKNTDKSYIYSDYPMSGKYEMSAGKDSGYYDLKANGMEYDWSKYTHLNVRFYSTKGNVTFGIVGAKNAARGAYDAVTNPWYYTTVTTAVGWNTVSLPVNGFTKWTNGSMSLSEMNYLQFMITDTSKGLSGKNDGIIYFDKIWLDNGEEHDEINTVAFYPESGTKSMPVRGAEIRIKTPQCGLAYVFDLDVQFFIDGQPIDIDFDSVLKDDLIISINDILEYDSSYSVNFKLNAVDEYDRAVKLDFTYEFTTVKEGANVSGIKLKSGGEEITDLPKNGEVTAEASLSNSTGVTETFILNIAAYDKNGAMTAMPVQKTYTLTQGEKNVKASVGLAVGDYSGMTVCAWITDENGVPLSTSFAGIGDLVNVPGISGAVSGAKSITINAELNIEAIDISGSESNSTDYVLVSVYNKNGTILIFPIYPSSEGKLNLSFAPNDTCDTDFYTVKAVGYGGASAETTVPYIGKSDRDSILLNVCNSGSESTTKSALAPFKNYFGYSDGELENAALILFEQKNEIKSYDTLVNMVRNGLIAFETVIKSDWSAFCKNVSEYATLLMNNDSKWEYYSSLSENVRNILAKEIVKKLPVTTIADLRDEIANVCDLYDDGKIEVPKPSKPSGGGGGGGGGSVSGVGGMSTGITDIQKTETEESKTEKPAENAENSVFGDVQNHWSCKYVNELYQKGIVSEADDGKFRPDDIITREEFVKLLVMAADLRITDEIDGRFTDVSDDWYTSYVYTAVKYGIINGYDETTFGIGDNITRQDAAVVCYRILNRSYIISDNSVKFTDDAEIADYAKEAVYDLRELEIISGFEDNSFRPQGTLLRGEAAKIIAEVMNFMNSN